jgi:predicted amidohydrolase
MTNYVSLLCLWLAVLAISGRASDIGKEDSITVASLSIFPKKWDKDANASKIEQMVRQTAKQGAQLIITPEGVLEGYVVNEVNNEKDPHQKRILTERFRAVAEPADGKYLTRFSQLANELNVHLILGFLESDGDRIYNTAALLGPEGQLIGKYHKTHFWQGYDVNPAGYVPGAAYPVFDIGKMKIGIMICADRRFPEVARILALTGADLIACPAYGSWGERNNAVMATRAFENQVHVVFTHPNQSLIINSDGDIISEGQKDTFIMRRMPLRNQTNRRASVIYRRPTMYKGLTTPTAMH